MFRREAFVINLCCPKPIVYKAQKPKGYPRPDLPDYVGEPGEYMEEPQYHICHGNDFDYDDYDDDDDNESYIKGNPRVSELRRMKEKEQMRQMTIQNQQIAELGPSQGINPVQNETVQPRYSEFNIPPPEINPIQNQTVGPRYSESNIPPRGINPLQNQTAEPNIPPRRKTLKQKPNMHHINRMKELRREQQQITNLLAPMSARPSPKSMTIDTKKKRPTFNPKNGAAFYKNKYSNSSKKNNKKPPLPKPDDAYPPSHVVPPAIKTTVNPDQQPGTNQYYENYQPNQMSSMPLGDENPDNKKSKKSKIKSPKKGGDSRKGAVNKNSKKASCAMASGKVETSNSSKPKKSIIPLFRLNKKSKKMSLYGNSSNNNGGYNSNNQGCYELDNEDNDRDSECNSRASSCSSLDTELSVVTKRKISAFKHLLKYILNHNYPPDQAIAVAYETVMQGYSYETILEDTKRLSNPPLPIYTFAANRMQKENSCKNDGTQTQCDLVQTNRPSNLHTLPKKHKRKNNKRISHKPTCRKTSTINSDNLLGLVRRGFTYQQLAQCRFNLSTKDKEDIK